MGSTEGRRRAGRVDLAMLPLVRLVCDDAWSVAAAGEELRRQVPDEGLLRRVRARVVGSGLERPTALGVRAVAILDAALAVGTTPVGVGA